MRVWRGAVVAGAITGAVVIGAGIASWTILGDLFDTTTVDRSAPVVLAKLSDLSDYHAASGEFSVLVDMEHDIKYVPSALAGDRTLFVGVGSVDAVVNFSGLGEGAIEVSPDGKSVTITLPQATLSRPNLDLAQSHVAGSDRGLLNRIGGVFEDDPTNEQPLYEAAQDKIATAATQSELLARGEENTRKMLQGLLGELGFDNVEVIFQGPPV